MSAIALDPLVAEAKRRAQRRRILLLAAVVFVAAGALTYELLPSGYAGESGRVSRASPVRHRTVGEVGSSGGVSWVMNGRGLWLTANGGHAWRKVAVPRGTGSIDRQGSSVQFVDPQHGWISINELAGNAPHLGDRSMFARTTDGGRTWQPSFPAQCRGRCGVAGMSFLDARHGYLIAGAPSAGIPNQLFRTEDGGRIWRAVAKTSVIGPITFLTNRVGLAFENNFWPDFYFGPPMGTLYRTTDGGRTWSKYDIGGSKSLVEPPIGLAGHRIVVVQNGPNRNGGVNIAPETINVSGDGRHWSSSAVPGTRSLQSSFTAVSPVAWVYSSGRVVYATEDAGHHWREIRLHGLITRRPYPPGSWTSMVDFTSSSAGWVVVNRRLYRTTDGGAHWSHAGPAKGKPFPAHACSPAQLRVSFWLSLSHENQKAHLSVENQGRHRCRLSPWTTVVAVKADGRTVNATRTSSRSLPARPIILRDGGSANAELEGIDLRRGAASACPRVVRLRVTPPGSHTVTTLAGPWRASFGRNFYFPLCHGMSVTALH